VLVATELTGTKKPAQLSLKQVLLSLAVFVMRPQAEFKSALMKRLGQAA
jgi:hypothetical protein